MSSFSSVVRKGPKVVPKSAPRRNIVRKAQDSPKAINHAGRETTVDSHTSSAPRVSEDADSLPSAPGLIDNASGTEQRKEPVEGETGRSSVQESEHLVHTSTVVLNSEPTEGSGTIPSLRHNATRAHLVEAGRYRPSAAVGRNEAGVANENEHEHDNHIAGHPIEDRTQSSVQPGFSPVSDAASDPVQRGISHASKSVVSPVLQTKFRQTRRRKQPPRASASIILSQPSMLATSTTRPAQPAVTSRSPEVERAASRPSPSVSVQADKQNTTHQDAFEQVRLRFQTLRDDVAAIPVPTPSPHPESRAPTATPGATVTDEETADRASSTRSRKRRKISHGPGQNAEEQAARIVRHAVHGDEDDTAGTKPKRHRGGTPEDAEAYEITPETTKMSELCKDSKRGKKSETEKEMAANWEEILRRRKEDAELRIAAAASGSRRKREKDRSTQFEIEESSGAAAVPDLVIENGQIVAASREVDRQGYLNGVVQDTDPSDIREDKDIFKRVLATTVGCRNPIAPGQTWDDLATELFYTGLKQFGTDFQMISAMIPGKTRKQVKLKYNVEERKNWPRVKKCLGMKEEVNLDEYAEVTGVQFASVADVYKQMEDDERRLREEDEQRRRDEGIISQDHEGATAEDRDESRPVDGDVVLPSIEGTADAATVSQDESTNLPTAGGERRSTVSRIGSTTTTRHTAQPTGKKKQSNKKNNANAKKSRQAAAKNKGLEGVEERIGGIEEVAMPLD